MTLICKQAVFKRYLSNSLKFLITDKTKSEKPFNTPSLYKAFHKTKNIFIYVRVHSMVILSKLKNIFIEHKT